ncbi:MAG: hypothetical protein V4590_12085 [Bacteroidota bacterium]
MKELEDAAWFPPLFRNFQTAFIGFVVTRFNFYTTFLEYLQGLSLEKRTMTDLCSGSGEPAISIFKQSRCFSSLVLTDKYPNVMQSKMDRVSYSTQTIDVLKMEFEEGTCYTMFNSFHHFTDKEKRHIVTKMQASSAGGFFVEVLEPTVICFLKVLLMTTVGNLLLTPFVHPFSVKRIFFTYIIPVNIFTITTDGLISVLKSRSVKQYRRLFPEQSIKILRLKSAMGAIIVIHI